MTAEELQDTLMNILEAIEDAREEVDEGEDDDTTLADLARDMASDMDHKTTVRTYGREMMLTRDAGLVIRLANGDEFQLTIVQTRHGRDDAEDEGAEFDDSDCSPSGPVG